ncbi:MAG TPA: 2,4'-dihydroxyacetophenone dioxygenase family protein [Holophagaceae bacterium]|nr:2,4'-dihydroxyacetophenone dioxygenase family protein [Holophagaceae bacterium]
MTTSLTSAPLDTALLPWVPLNPGIAFKPLAYFPDNAGWQLLLRVEPGTVIPLHRHTGEVHAFNLAGHRRLDTGEVVGPGMYVFEPAGNVDTWQAIGDEPCIIHIEVRGRNEYLDEAGHLLHVADAEGSRRSYLQWCEAQGEPVHPAFRVGA